MLYQKVQPVSAAVIRPILSGIRHLMAPKKYNLFLQSFTFPEITSEQKMHLNWIQALIPLAEGLVFAERSEIAHTLLSHIR